MNVAKTARAAICVTNSHGKQMGDFRNGNADKAKPGVINGSGLFCCQRGHCYGSIAEIVRRQFEALPTRIRWPVNSPDFQLPCPFVWQSLWRIVVTEAAVRWGRSDCCRTKPLWRGRLLEGHTGFHLVDAGSNPVRVIQKQRVMCSPTTESPEPVSETGYHQTLRMSYSRFESWAGCLN